MAAEQSEVFDRMLGASKDTALHESIGRTLTNHIFTNFTEPKPRDFARLCFAIAESIAVPKPDHPLLKCLHSIMSGNLDADRCDYVRRDGLASGFEFGDFDLERILHTLRFFKVGKQFDLLPTTAAVSALESFFLERYRIFRWLVFHPKVVELDLHFPAHSPFYWRYTATSLMVASVQRSKKF